MLVSSMQFLTGSNQTKGKVKIHFAQEAYFIEFTYIPRYFIIPSPLTTAYIVPTPEAVYLGTFILYQT